MCGMFFLYFDTWSMCVFDTSRKKMHAIVMTCLKLIFCGHFIIAYVRMFTRVKSYCDVNICRSFVIFLILLKLFDLQNVKHRRSYNSILSKTFINYSVVYHPNLKACRMSHVDTRCNATFDKIKNCWKGFMTFSINFVCSYVLNEIIWCYLGGMWSDLKYASLSK